MVSQHNPMKSVDLFTAPGPHPDFYVTTVLVPNFAQPPEVITWGDRTFVLAARISPLAGDTWAFKEVFHVPALEEDTNAPQRIERLKAARQGADSHPG